MAAEELILDRHRAITNGDTIIGFQGPDKEPTTLPIRGLNGEKIKAIEYDPDLDNLGVSDKFLAVGDNGGVFEIDSTGQAKLIGSIPEQFRGVPLDIDLDPMTGDIFVVNKIGLLIKFNREKPTIFKINEFLYGKDDPNMNKVGKGAFTFTEQGGFLLDVINGVLAQITNLEFGLVKTVGPLNLGDITAMGFDTNPLTNRSFASIVTQGQTLPDLYEIDLASGEATKLGPFGDQFEGLTITPPLLKNFHCVVSPPEAINKTGTSHTINVTVFSGSTEIGGIDRVDYKVLSGPNVGAGADFGDVSFTYQSNGLKGIDIIEATVIDGIDTASCTAKKQWVDAPDIAAVTKNKKKLTVMGQFDTTADNRILVDGKEQATKTVSDTELLSKKGGKKAKPDSVITVKSNGNPSNDFRVDQPPAGLQCVLTPQFAITQIEQGKEQKHNLTLQVFANGKLISEELTVAFEIIAGPNSFGVANKIDAGGTFTHSYTSNGKPGFDVIKASGTFKGGPFSCLAVKRWQ